MDETSHYPHHEQNGYAKLAVGAVATLLVASIGQGFLAWRDLAVLNATVEELAADHARDIRDIRERYSLDAATLAAIAEQTHANSIHRVEHDKSAEHWIGQIKDNTRSVRKLEQDPNARRDPFTGTEGKALEDRIKALERR
jgi:hypothetical protein